MAGSTKDNTILGYKSSRFYGWQAEKLGLVSGPNDGLYTLEEDGLSWSGVSDIAQDTAPVHLRDMYSKEGCLNLF
jgi:hypothetical protein